MDQIMDLAQKHSLFVLEDAAQSFGARWRDRSAGSMGDMAALSFFPSKNLGCFGDGGMIATADEELAGLAKMLRTHGGKDKYDVEHIGYNSRLDTIQAAVLLVKLKHVDRLNNLRKKIAYKYNEQLKDIKWLTLPLELEEAEHAYHQYTVRISAGKRDYVQVGLEEKGIASAVYYPVPLHQMKVFQNHSRQAGNLKHAEEACREVLSLPVEPLLKEEELGYIIKHLKNIKM